MTTSKNELGDNLIAVTNNTKERKKTVSRQNGGGRRVDRIGEKHKN